MHVLCCREMVECFKALDSDSDIRAIVISGRGKLFTGGLDLMAMMSDMPDFFDTGKETARRAKSLHKTIQDFQQSFTQIEEVIVYYIYSRTILSLQSHIIILSRKTNLFRLMH